MPLDTEADYERLASHLNAIDPVVQPFSLRHGYTLLQWPMGGRYPNRKMHMHRGMVWKSIQVAMDVRPDGGRFDEFYPEIPYTVFAGAWVDDYQACLRWFAPHMTTHSIPFCQLAPHLLTYLEQAHSYLTCFDESLIRSFGRSHPIGKVDPPP